MRALAATALLVLLAGCGDAPGEAAPTLASAGGSATGTFSSDDLVVAGGWSNPQGPSEPLMPWSLEASARIVSLGRVHEPVTSGERELLKLELTEVLKGKPATDVLFPEDAQPFLGCIPPESIPAPSQLFPPGSDVLIYLEQQPGGSPSILQITGDPGPAHVQRILQFVRIEAALRDPKPDWASLLPPEGNLDDLMHWAFVHVRPQHAGPALRAMLVHTLARFDAGESPPAAHLAALTSHLAEQPFELETLALLDRLIGKLVALEDDALFLAYWPSCSPGSIYQHVPPESTHHWAEMLDRIRRRTDAHAHALQEATHSLARLPGGAGVQILIDALDTHRSQVASSLSLWVRANPIDTARRAAIRSRVEALRADPALRGDEHLTFRRHLDALMADIGG